MAGVSATTTLEARLNGWLLGIVGLSELGTAVLDGTLTDITPDTRGFQPLELSYGIMATGPTDRIAGVGTLVFALDNSAANSVSQAGAYSPGHTNAVSGWEVGVEIRLSIEYDSVTYYKFVGTVVDIQPDAGKTRQAVMCTAVDWMDSAARAKIKNVTIATDQRADQLINTLVTESVSVQPTATSYAEGQTTFEISLDNLEDAKTSVLKGLADCVLSELGYLYIKGDTSTGGVLTFEDRHSRPKAGAALGSFDNSMGALRVTRSREEIINRVYVVVHPRITATENAVIFELTTTGSNPEVPANGTLTINCPFKETSINAYRVAASSLVTPVSGEDWISNSQADGGGDNLTSDVTVTIKNEAANSAELEITNANTTQNAYLTTLQLRGISVRDVSETVLSASDTASAFTYGEIDTRIDMKYEQRSLLGNEIADWILNVYKDPRYTVQEFMLQSNKSSYLMEKSLSLEIGDKVTFAEDFTGITETGASGAEIGYFINGVRMTITVPGTIQTSWVLAPASGQAAWVLQTVGASELGVTTTLGFV